MSLSPDTILQVVEIVQKAVVIYHKIKDGPDQMKKIGRRMERLSALLVNLEHHVRSKSKTALARLRKSQTEHLLAVIDDTKADCTKVYELFDKWDNNTGPFGFQFRFATVAQAYFLLGTNADKLEALAGDIEEHRKEIDTYLGLMGAEGIEDNLKGIKRLQDDNNAMKKQLDAIQQLLQAGQPGPALVVAGAAAVPGGALADAPKPNAPRPGRPSPSPSPSSPKRDLQIIFVDPFNLGRSVIAATITRLTKEWTLQAGGDWRILKAQSAGFFVKKGCDCVDVIENLDYSYQSYKKPMGAGDAKANATAVQALFDNKSFDYPFKKTVKDGLDKRRSRGVRRNIFAEFDYIIVFTAREHDNMIALRKALIAKDGKAAAPKGKGRVIHLGRYLTMDGVPREIIDPPKNQDGSDIRANWNFKISQIKMAIKGFLREETRWTAPKSNAQGSS